MLKPESTGYYSNFGTDREPFMPGLDQPGLLGREFLPPSHQVDVNAATTLSLPLEVEKKERRIKQGSFELHDLSELNTVVQQRKIYEDIEGLAANILEAELLIHPLFVVRYSTENAAHQYLYAAYSTVGKNIPPERRKRIPDLVRSTHEGSPCWYILIAGHRRLRALEMDHETESVVQVFDDMDPFKALHVQVSENTSKLPKDFERAEQNGDLWTIDSAMESNLTIEDFAKRVGHRPDIVRRDFLYYVLPDAIKDMVVPRGQVDTGHGNTKVATQPLMPFRVACQLGRLVERKVPMNDILLIARNFWDENITSEESAKKRINNYLKAYNMGALDMNSLFGYNAEETAKQRRNYQIGQRYVKPVESAITFLDRVVNAADYGFDTSDDQVAFALAARKIKILATKMDNFLEVITHNFKERDIEKIKNTIDEMNRSADLYGKFVSMLDTDQYDEDREEQERNERALLDGKEIII